MTDEEKIKKYPKTEQFEVVDTIGVPHPFCITPKHIEAAQDYGGMLGGEAIKNLEFKTKRSSCGMKGCNLMFEQHEQALLVKCKTKDNELTKAYLQSIVKQCEADGFAGFTLLDGTEG